jgi:hypothetical protein
MGSSIAEEQAEDAYALLNDLPSDRVTRDGLPPYLLHHSRIRHQKVYGILWSCMRFIELAENPTVSQSSHKYALHTSNDNTHCGCETNHQPHHSTNI